MARAGSEAELKGKRLGSVRFKGLNTERIHEPRGVGRREKWAAQDEKVGTLDRSHIVEVSRKILFSAGDVWFGMS